jgi:hypothetical protein
MNIKPLSFHTFITSLILIVITFFFGPIICVYFFTLFTYRKMVHKLDEDSWSWIVIWAIDLDFKSWRLLFFICTIVGGLRLINLHSVVNFIFEKRGYLVTRFFLFEKILSKEKEQFWVRFATFSFLTAISK